MGAQTQAGEEGLMENTIASAMRPSSTKTGGGVADLRLVMAEHIIAHDGTCGGVDVQGILSETKVGAWRKTDLLKKLKVVFSAS